MCLCSATGNYDVTNSDDCYDGNANAKPGQSSYFSSNRGDGSYDYNCDGSQSKRFTGSGGCYDRNAAQLTIYDCDKSSTGWTGSVAACGATADYIDHNSDCDAVQSCNSVFCWDIESTQTF